MPLLELDTSPALIVVDVQSGTTANPTAHPVEDIIAGAARLAKSFRASALPVVLARVNGTPAGRTAYGSGERSFPDEWATLRPELDAQPGDIHLTRRTWSAFAGTDLDVTLRERAVTQVVIVGLATSFGVESTARAAYDLGYSVVLATDAMTDPRRESHDGSVERVFPALGQTTTVEEIVGAMSALGPLGAR
jgi:nicotinamidase-related amidase